MPTITHAGGTRFTWSTPLIEATIVERPNRFIIMARLASGEVVRTHCPSTGSIGNLILNGLKCLLSPVSEEIKRATRYTVEAISIPLEDGTSPWVGINQTAANAYVDAALRAGLLHAAFTLPSKVKREPRLGASRLDFLLDDKTYVEVKMPLKDLQLPIASTVAKKTSTPTASTRLIDQVKEATEAIKVGQEFSMVVLFCYPNPRFTTPRLTTKVLSAVQVAMAEARSVGMETWQLNVAIDADGFTIERFFNLGEIQPRVE